MRIINPISVLSSFLIIFVCFPISCLQAEVRTSGISIAACRRVAPTLSMELGRIGVQLGSPIFIRIFKESHELEVWVKAEEEYRLFKSYEICKFSGELGPKSREGDLQSPEGFYAVGENQLNPNSRYHLSFDLGYPNTYDKLHGRTGSALMIHGDCMSVGCFAMTDSRIEEIYTLAEEALRNGQQFFPVHIFPFKMTTANMRRHQNSPWISFWNNLKEGYDYFEKNFAPPRISVSGEKYVFQPGYTSTAGNGRASKIFN